MLQKNQQVSKKALKVRVKKRLAKKKAALSNRVKKIFDGDKNSLNIVMFEENLAASHQVPLTAANISSIKVKVVEHPLDQYSSPHVLDLSAKRYIERVRPILDNGFVINYRDLPAGEILEKLQVFQLLSINDSEILNWLKRFWAKLTLLAKKPFQQVDFSPKLPLIKATTKSTNFAVWQDVSLINFLLFIFSKITIVLETLGQLARYFYINLIGQYLGRDEIIAFNQPRENIGESKPTVPVKNKISVNWPGVDFKNLFSSFKINQAVLRPIVAFLAVALLIVIPLETYFYFQDAEKTKGQVLGQAEEALGSLALAQKSLADWQFGEASGYLVKANQDFVSAQKQLDEIKSFLTVLAETLPLNNTYRSGKNLLALGEKLTKAGEFIISGLNQLSTDSDFSLSSRIKNFKVDSQEALSQLISAKENINKINLSHLPKDNREKFASLKANLPIFISSLKKSDAIMDFAINFLGDKSLKRYLIVFQNDNELRASGGFMGSVALVDFKNGNIENIQVPAGGTYDFKAGLTKLLQAPQPLRLVNPRWEFQDANWWPNWPTSAKNISYFYNKSDGATLDGVIAVNSDWLGSLLEVIGPINLPDYKKTITAANFEMELQKSIEVEATDKTKPKKILGDLAPELLKRILDTSPDKMMDLILALNTGLKQKDILVYLADENEQKFVAESNWDGRLKETEKDYLNVVATNIGGGKTDSVISQEIYHRAEILADGSIIDSVLISRNHTGAIDDKFTKAANRSYIRVYVPQGSQLLKVSGFKPPKDKEYRPVPDYLEKDPILLNEDLATVDQGSQTKIYIEDNKTVFANWLTTAPGDTQEALLVYKLPFKLDLTKKSAQPENLIGKVKAVFSSKVAYDSYSLLVQKQPGSGDSKFVSQVEYADNLDLTLAYPDQVEIIKEGRSYKNNLSEDLFYFIGLSR